VGNAVIISVSIEFSYELDDWNCTLISNTVLLLSVGPIANATDVLQPNRLIVLTLSPLPVWTFPRLLTGTSTSPMMREILVSKGGSMWARINQKFCLKLWLPRQFRDLLLPFWKKACWGFFHLEKSWQLQPGLNPRTWVLKGSTLPLDHRSRFPTRLEISVFSTISRPSLGPTQFPVWSLLES